MVTVLSKVQIPENRSGNATESVEIGGPGSMKHHHKHKGDDDDNEGDKENVTRAGLLTLGERGRWL